MASPLASRILTPSITTPETQETVSFLGELYHLRVTGDDTAGGFAVIETLSSQGHSSPMHIHRHDNETFVVLSTPSKIQTG